MVCRTTSLGVAGHPLGHGGGLDRPVWGVKKKKKKTMIIIGKTLFFKNNKPVAIISTDIYKKGSSYNRGRVSF